MHLSTSTNQTKVLSIKSPPYSTFINTIEHYTTKHVLVHNLSVFMPIMPTFCSIFLQHSSIFNRTKTDQKTPPPLPQIPSLSLFQTPLSIICSPECHSYFASCSSILSNQSGIELGFADFVPITSHLQICS